LAISFSREKGTGGGAKAVNGCVSSVIDMSLGCPSGGRAMWETERTPSSAGAAAIEGAALGIRRLRRDKDGLFVSYTEVS
jgi:hypothetical protein